MTEQPVARHIAQLLSAMQPFADVVLRPELRQLLSDPRTSNFVAGNPQELASPTYVEILQCWAVPRDKDWYAYKLMDPAAQRAAAASLSQELGMSFNAEGILLARGAHGGLVTALKVVVDRGDEVIFVSQAGSAHAGHDREYTPQPDRQDLSGSHARAAGSAAG